jgi:ABC-2 type transport system permease protein
VVFVIFLVLSGYFFSAILFVTQEASMTGVAYNMIITLLFLLPLISMKLFAEEKKLGTLEILMTKPVKDFEVVMGKFLAAVSLFTTMLLSTLVYVLILFKYGNPDSGPIMASYLGIFLCGISFIALGLFASSLTENQIISAVIGFSLVLLLWILNWLSGYVGEGLQNLLNYLALSTHLDDFIKGVIDVKHLVYYMSFVVLFIFASIKSIEARKWK